MSVTPSPIGGFAAQFFDNNGVILSGGKIYTYAAGTTTPQATYTSASGVTPHANPIILDSAGRVPGGEIWLTDGLVYKFVIETATAILIGTYDNITGINSNFVNYTVQEEVITATAGQTVFNLSTINYTPATNSLTVYIDGVNQYVGDSYIETDSDTVTFTSGVHVGGEVKFTTAIQTTTGSVDASIVTYDPPFTGGVITNVEDKLAQYISVKDFGAVGDGVTDDTTAVQAFLDACKDGRGYMPSGIYKITAPVTLDPEFSYVIEGAAWTNDGLAGTVIYNAGTGNAVVIDNTPYTPPNFDSEIKLMHLVIRGNINSENGLYVNQTPVYMENIWLTGHGENGMSLVRPYGSSFRQVTCANNYQSGAFINTAGNLNYFDHCVFNGNGLLDAHAGVFMTSTPDPLSENFAVTFVACDFTGNGTSVATGFGALVTKTIGVSFIGCYWESNKTNNLYVDNTVKNLSVSGCYFQDSDNFIDAVDGVVYENNFHLQVSGSMQVDITGGMPTARLPARMFGNTYSGGATSNPQAGISENIQLWFTSPPSGGTWKRGDIVWNSAFQAGGGIPGWTCVTAGTPGTWLPMGQAPYVLTNAGDNSATLTAGASFPTNIWRSPLTANRTVTLSTTDAFSGAKFRINRTSGATGAFTLDVGGIKTLAAGQWCDVEWDGSAWVVTAFGSL